MPPVSARSSASAAFRSAVAQSSRSAASSASSARAATAASRCASPSEPRRQVELLDRLLGIAVERVRDAEGGHRGRVPRASGTLEVHRRGGVEEHPLHAQRPHHPPQDRACGGERGAAVRQVTVEGPALRGVQAPLRPERVAVQRPHPGGGDRQRRVAGEAVVVQGVQPAADRTGPAGGDEVPGVPVHQQGGGRDVPAGDRVRDRLLRQPVLLVPAGRALVHPGLLAGLAAAQLGQEHLRDQAVIAVPLAVPVQRHDEQAASGGLGQPAGGAAAAEHVVAQRAAHLLERGGAQQEPHGLRRLVGEQLVPEVVDDERVVAGQPAGRFDRVRRGPDRERGQVHPGRPALGAPEQGPQGVVGAADSRPDEDRPGLLLGERQLVRTELDAPVLAAQPAEAERQPGPDRDVEPGRQPRRERADEVHRLDVAQLMDVVEYQHARPRPAPQRREQVGQRGDMPRPVPDRQRLEHRRVERLDPLQRHGDVTGQAHRIAVRLVERDPGEPPAVRGRPLAQRRRLPVPGRRGEQDERDVRRDCGEPSEQLRPRDQTVPVHRQLDRRHRRRERQLRETGRRHASVLVDADKVKHRRCSGAVTSRYSHDRSSGQVLVLVRRGLFAGRTSRRQAYSAVTVAGGRP